MLDFGTIMNAFSLLITEIPKQQSLTSLNNDTLDNRIIVSTIRLPLRF